MCLDHFNLFPQLNTALRPKSVRFTSASNLNVCKTNQTFICAPHTSLTKPRGFPEGLPFDNYHVNKFPAAHALFFPSFLDTFPHFCGEHREEGEWGEEEE